MDKTLNKFISPFLIYRDEEKKHNFSSQLREQPGLYCVPGDNISTFWNTYCDQLTTHGTKFISGLSERPREFMPVLGDIDISLFEDEETHSGRDMTKHLYNEKHVKHIVSIYIDVLKYLVEGYDPQNLFCFVLEKSKPNREENKIKSGFHLHFPLFYLSQLDISANLFERVKKRVEEEEVFKDIGIEHSGDVIDRGMEKKYWLLYGSRKSVNKEAYKLTKIYNDKCKIVKLEDIKDDIKVYNLSEEIIDLSENIESKLPEILSINSFHRPIFDVKKEIEFEYKRKLPKSEAIIRYSDDRPVPELLEETRKLLKIIKSSRADHHDTWMQMGWVLYNIGEGCNESLDLWIEFSSKTTKNNFSEEGCIKQWKTMTKRDMTIGTLKKWAKEDSAEGYEEYLRESSAMLLKESIAGTHYDLAKQLYVKYAQQFVCGSIVNNRWFEYSNNRWKEVEAGYGLRKKIANELIPKFINLLKDLAEDYRLANGEDTKKLTDNQNRIGKLLLNLKDSNFKDKVMKECKEFFYNEDFLSKLDQDPYLLGFNNGVLDLKMLCFRNGKPDDYVSKSAGYDFKTFKDDDPEIDDIRTFLMKIFPNPSLRTYFIEYGARLLKGGNHEKTFIVMSGEKGDNGKSVTIELIQKMLGDYAVNLPATLITGKRNASSAASPELARCKGIRFAAIQEPDGKDTINGGTLKELTGSDAMFIRGLFKDGGDVKLMFKLAFVCNKLPKLSSDDQAIWNRVRVLLFESVFPKDTSLVPENFDEQFKQKIFERDDKLSEKFDSMRQALMWVFYQTFIHINRTTKKSVEPREVMEATRSYRQNNDFFLQFINEVIKEDKSSKGVNLTEVYASFKDWFHDTFSGLKTPSKNDLRDDLYTRWGVPKFNKWERYRIRSEQDDVDEGFAMSLNSEDFTDTEETEE